jgi:predicted secreted protein
MALNLGENMRLTLDGKLILHEVSASLSFTKDFKEVASKDTNGKLVSPGSNSWNFSVEGLWENDGTVKQDLFAITTMANADAVKTVSFSTGISGDPIFSGNAYVEGFTVDAANEEYVTFSFTVKGSGDLTIAEVV